MLSTPDEEILGTSHPYINRLVPIRAPAALFAAELEELEEAVCDRDKETVRHLLFTAGLDLRVRRRLRSGTSSGATSFEWPELDRCRGRPRAHRDVVAAYRATAVDERCQVRA